MRRQREHLWVCLLSLLKLDDLLIYIRPYSDTHTDAELTVASMRFLQESRNTKPSQATAIRDRAMQLLNTSMAGRGEFVRGVLLSDLAHEKLPLPDLDLDATIDVSILSTWVGIQAY